jgi:hypothetical protein
MIQYPSSARRRCNLFGGFLVLSSTTIGVIPVNQTNKGSSSQRVGGTGWGSTAVTVKMNDGSRQVIDVSTIPECERIALHGTVNGKPVQSATICRPKGSRDVIISTTRNPNHGIALTLNETIAISQNAELIAKKFGGPNFSIDSGGTKI